ncbi:unannotated protein [freshwater metagenome]|uniref:Unannotated protein n=1 Tax=freshwater metagenome TaxID=449393 RepID=A0A6J7FJ71_9ZZZZ|nr:translational machinery protein [Actinomycetota bacterium]
MPLSHTIVWIDHRDATIIDFSFDDQHVLTVHHDMEDRKLHHKANTIGSGRVLDDPRYFEEIIAAMGNAHEVLIAGPGTAKLAFRKYLDQRHASLGKRVVGVETLDHPSEGELLAYARRYFKAVDQLAGPIR